MPRLMTSMPWAFFSEIFRSSSANRYGGRRSRRSLDFKQFLQELVAERALVHRHRPSGQIDVHVLPDLDLQLAAVQLDGDRTLDAAQHGGDRRADGARAGRHRL